LLLLSDYRRLLSSRLHRFRIALRTRGWRGVLARADSASDAAADARAPAPIEPIPAPHGRRVLVIDATIPKPDRDSGSVRAVNLMREMRRRGDAVDFVPDDGRFEQTGHALRLEALGIDVRRAATRSDYPRLLREGGYDTAVVLDTVDLHHLREGREAKMRGDRRLQALAAETRRRELATVAAADATWVVSPVEHDLLQQALPGARVVVLPNIVQAVAAVSGFDARGDLLFVGGARHPPNLDAVRWLLQDIFPRVRARLPGCTLHVVGAGFPQALSGLPIPEGARIHGFVPDIDPMLMRCRIGLAPLRFGAGVKGKINACMAFGMPVVATPCAAEGMHLQDGEDVLIADDAGAFADAVARLHSDQALWNRLSEAGLRNVRRYFSFEAARQALDATFAGND
jgi:glycosyltransferase involved in cell wall biosynthesis